MAEKLRLYRPYLPAHVFASGEGDQEASDLDELMTVSARSCGGAPSKVSSPAQRRKTASTSSVPTGRQLVCVTRHHPTLAHRGLEANNGTLLSVRITQVDEVRSLLLFAGGGGGSGTRPRYLIVCLWRRLLVSRRRSF